jgi:mannose-6-phosphate isomerase-like protein (cupin superfamily)
MPFKNPRFGAGFSVVMSNERAQAATMVIAPGDSEGGPENRHRGADQWLFVLSGSGIAILGGRKHRLKAHSLILIERGTTHEIRNTGRTPLKRLKDWAGGRALSTPRRTAGQS